MEVNGRYIREGVILRKIECPLYIRKVQLSAARNKNYYESGLKSLKKVNSLKKFSDKTKFDWREHKVNKRMRTFLTNLKTGERVVSNPIAAGTPKVEVINGQGIHSGQIRENVRNTMMDAIKDFFLEHLEGMESIDQYPVSIFCEVHNIPREFAQKIWDLDNHFLMYQKAFQDVLTGNRGKNKSWLIDDNNLFITQPPSPIFIPIDDYEQRKLVFYIVKEEDSRILSHVGHAADRELEIKKYNNGVRS